MDIISRISSLLADRSLEAIATLRYIRAILDGEVAVPGDIGMLMAQLACDGYVNPEIDDERFPGADAFVSIEGVTPVDIGRDWMDQEAIAFLAAMVPPMQPVNPDKGIKWAANNPEAQRRNPLFIIGQKCRDSDECVCILMLSGLDTKRSANLYSVQHRFRRHCLVLAEPKQLAPET